MGIPVATIDANGISAPLFTDVLVWLQEQYMAIYGSDVDLDADTQDGQWVAVVAQAIHDTNQTLVSTYNAYSPTYAQGAGLSSVVKINGIRRLSASYSMVDVLCVGQAGTDISGGVVGDNLNMNSQWQLPGTSNSRTLIIPPEGQIQTTGISLTPGAIHAAVGTITRIVTPIPGWQTVYNAQPGVQGAPVESDAQLRRRQTYSVANPSQTVVVGIQGAVGNLPGVQRVMVYENATSATDENGLPPYSMAAVVQGGDSQAIAQMIALRKTPGSPTFGTTNVLVFDTRGIPSMINYFTLSLVPITVNIYLNALPGYTQAIEQNVINNVVDFLTTLPIGYDSYISKLIAATEVGEPDGLTYDVTSVLQSRDGNPPAAADVPVSYIEAVTADTTIVTITVNNLSPLRWAIPPQGGQQV